MRQLYSWLVALADSYDGFLIDLDGVVWLGHEPIAGAAEALVGLEAAGKPFAFVTNSPRVSPARQAAILRDHGIETDPGRIVTSGTTLLALVRERVGEGAKVFATGTADFLAQVKDAGFEPLPPERWPEAAGLLISGHDAFGYEELKAASMAARSGIFFAATGRDPTMPMPDGLWPGTGAILAAIEVASGRQAIVAGKPERPIFEAGLEVLGLPTGSRVAMIGDRLDTDVGGAQQAGLDGILVTGNDSVPADSGITPEHRIDGLADLLA
jgi:HAD superfamily hydrolase (TIGR01450 family)